MTWEHDLHLYMKRAKANEVAFGDATWHRERVARLMGGIESAAGRAERWTSCRNYASGAGSRMVARHRARRQRQQLAALRRDPVAFLAELTRQDGHGRCRGRAHRAPAGQLFWLDDGEFCGSHQFSLRRREPTRCRPYVHGHIGYAVVPWKRRRGYATRRAWR